MSSQMNADLDIEYGDHERQRLDVFYQSDRENRPIALTVVGGGWSQSDRANFHHVAKYFAGLGFTAVALSYRVTADGDAFPDPVSDVARAAAWSVEHADAYGADPERVLVVGSSAGAHLGAMVAYRTDRDWLAADDDRSFDATSVTGFIGINGAYFFDRILHDEDPHEPFLGELYDDPDRWAEAEPATALSADDPPALLFQGANDAVVGPMNSIAFADALESAGTWVDLAVLPGKGHGRKGVIAEQPTDPRIAKRILEFVTYFCL